MGVLLHVAGDAANNFGVVIAGAIIWKTSSFGRYYADPAVSMAIASVIFFSSIPIGLSADNLTENILCKTILTWCVSEEEWLLLKSAPPGVDAKDVEHDIMQVSPSRMLFYSTVNRIVTDKLLGRWCSRCPRVTNLAP